DFSLPLARYVTAPRSRYNEAAANYPAGERVLRVSSSCRDQLRCVFVFSFNFCDFFVGQTKIGSADVSLDLLRVARADDGAGHCWISQCPSDSDLPRRTPVAFADPPQALNQREILRQPWFLELGVATSPIARREGIRAFARHRAGQQAGGHWRIDNYAKFFRSAVRENFLFDLAAN